MSQGDSNFVDVQTNFGKIRGVIRDVGKDSKVACFLGVPYAKQPVGPLRFRRLEPLDSKLDNGDGSPYMATKYGASSIQTKTTFFSTQLDMAEACIYLNIYVNLGGSFGQCQDVSEILGGRNQPVFFHIHGGAFIRGSGSEPYYNMTYFAAKHDAVCISINYRLSTLGFLSYPGAIEENLGLLDQQFALKWTHDNVGSFGGDVDNVTIFGCSAGGASVQYHLMSPESSKYFARAIAVSGTFNKIWCRTSRAKQRRKIAKFLKKVGCPDNLSPQQIGDYLRSLPVEALSGEGEQNVKKLNDEFIPVDTFEEEGSSENGGGTGSRAASLLFARKPLILGMTSEEGKLFPDVVFPRDCNKKPTWARETVADFVTEKYFSEPLRSLIDTLSSIPDYPFSVYFFDYDCQSRSAALPESALPRHYGVFHSCDVPFILSSVSEVSEVLKPTGSDTFVGENMAKIIGTFIHVREDLFPLERYKKFARVNRVSSQGITQEGNEILRTKRRFLNLKFATAGALLLANSNVF